MADSTIRAALEKVENTLSKKPPQASPDSPAHAVLTAGLAIQVRHPKGQCVTTDMPASLGGGGGGVPPGWLMRAGLASCFASVIVMRAERIGIALTRLEVTANTLSDARGMLGLDASVPAGPTDVELQVEVEAEGVGDEALAELVAWADAHSPVGDAMRRALDVRVTINGKTDTATR
jgi:uncharacterized OsmC-like protein